MPTTTAPDDNHDHRHHLGTTGRITAADLTRRRISRWEHHADEAAALAVTAGAQAEVCGDGASS